MTEFIDQKGRLLGKVNIIDFLVLLFFIAVLVAGYSVVHSPAAEVTHSQFEFEATTTAVKADALMEQEPYGEGVAAVSQVEIIDEDSRYIDGAFQEVTVVRFVATLPVTESEAGQLQYQQERLLIGETYRLDLGYTILDAVLIGGVSGR